MSRLCQLSLGIALLLFQTSFGQAELKTMFYNLLNFSSAPPTNRLEVLNSILDTYHPDLFMVCEVESQQDGLDILNQSFTYTSAPMAQAPFLFNTSGASLIHQLVYFDSNKLSLDYTNQIETNVRSINHYSFTLNTSSELKLEVFVAHFKASRGENNVDERAFEAQQFINYIQGFPADANILIAGDFNLYSASEPAYSILRNGTANFEMVDPLNRMGEWSNNSNFEAIHTQSTRLSNSEFDDFGAGGGLDDRFDFMMISEAMSSSSHSVSYIENTYKTLGNNGNCFNNSINSLDCSGNYSLQLREWLYQMSDHLPVVMDIAVNEDLLSVSRINAPAAVIINGTLVKEQLDLEFSSALKSKKVRIYDLLGQEITSFDVTNLETILDISSFASGLYFLHVENYPIVEKFYINH